MKLSHILLLIMVCWLPAQALAWWNEEWPYRLPVTVDTSAAGADVSEGVENFTVLVKLHAGNFEDFFLLQENLGDLRFIGADDKTPLKFHVEHFDMLNQMAYIWVKLPVIEAAANSGRFWMYYGNQQAAAAEDAGSSYDQATALVYHFQSNGSELKDFSAYQLQGAVLQGNLVDGAAIAGGLELAGSLPLLIPDMPQLQFQPDQGQTYSFWVNLAQLDQGWILNRSSQAGELSIGFEAGGIFIRLVNAEGEIAETTPATGLAINSWHHVAVTVTADSMQLFVDGNSVATTPARVMSLAGDIRIGDSLAAGSAVAGQMDALRIDNSVRDVNWLRLVMATQGVNARLLRTQPAEQLGAGGGYNFWSVIISSTEQSGWMVIIMLGMMALVSWLVMIGKFIYVRRVNQDNHGFLEQYRKLDGSDPSVLNHEETSEDLELDDAPIVQAIFGSHDHFQSSPIYRVYHRGITEIQARLGKSVGARATSLNRQSMDAIRASLDAQMIREAQRLNAKMVLLTIAISGGPFLGLFGTVLGVMITFAAIAATGDVNISAIAPGVAAALLTTVAGLVVAIPALFGYNYLASQIKEAIADMRVFTDEFLTRVAEYYGQ